MLGQRGGRVKISLALSGGGVRALAHLGVIDTLREEGFEIMAVSGSSGGALVGAMLADGLPTDDIRSFFSHVKSRDLMRGILSKGGLFSLKWVEKILEERLGCNQIEELSMPFIVAATDIKEGRIRYFDEGPIARLCIGSSSLTPFFSPMPYEDMLLADGGLMDNMPTWPLQKFGYPVIGVNVNPIAPEEQGNVFKTTYRALVLMMASNIEASRRFADFYIEVDGCRGINIFDFTLADRSYSAGVEEAKSVMTELKVKYNTIRP